MGASASSAEPGVTIREADCYGDGENGTLVLSENSISPEILNHILSFVPKDDLLRNCSLVCKFWKSLLDSQAVWKLKCVRERIPFPHLVDIPPHFYRQLCFKNPFGRNLIKNPHGDEQLLHWTLQQNGGEGWKVESPPDGVDPFTEIPELKNVKSCFATSYGECIKHQILDLVREGCPEEILDNLQPEIRISDWYAARFDCASRYTLEVLLMDHARNTIDSFVHGPIDEQQWVGKEWHKVEHSFKNYGPGLRYIVFQQLGHDLQFWAGHYGSKMTASSVRFHIN